MIGKCFRHCSTGLLLGGGIVLSVGSENVLGISENRLSLSAFGEFGLGLLKPHALVGCSVPRRRQSEEWRNEVSLASSCCGTGEQSV